MLLNVLPSVAYPRDDTQTGGGFGSAILSIAAIIFILWIFSNEEK
jgi:hypothetical protein